MNSSVPRGHWAMSRDHFWWALSFGCHDWRCCWHLAGGGHRCCSVPCIVQDSAPHLQQRMIQPQMSVVPRSGNVQSNQHAWPLASISPCFNLLQDCLLHLPRLLEQGHFCGSGIRTGDIPVHQVTAQAVSLPISRIGSEQDRLSPSAAPQVGRSGRGVCIWRERQFSKYPCGLPALSLTSWQASFPEVCPDQCISLLR